IPAERVNSQWLWGADLEFNRANGHAPDDQLLFVARWTSALFGAVSIAAMYALARRLIGPGAWLAALIYATLPAVLLNARRATFEGALLAMLSLALLLAVDLARRLERRGAAAWRRWLWLGIVAGLAVTAKHTAIIVFPPALVALTWIGRRKASRTLAGAVMAMLAAGAVFFALNPAWWNMPLRMPGEVLRLRAELLAGQTAAFGGFTSLGERMAALGSAPLGPPQYYEAAQGWPEWIGGQIAAYESAGLAGIAWGGLGVLGAALALIGLAVVVRRRGAAGLVFGAVALFLAAALLALNPVPWQRYYLPLAMPYALALGGGLVAVVGALWRAARVRHVE
ncbi:MAG: glycosyltransferase family 39 protein, partial [Anaerolineae bacterium]|nr:glycosyltransferase family 39 protein [Anaerolineae bacterium]